MFKLPDVEGYIKDALSTTKEILAELKLMRSLLEDIADLQAAPYLDSRENLPGSNVEDFTNADYIQDYYNRIDERNK